MDEIITFDKSLQTRLQEYEELFSGLKTVPFSKIQGEWAYYLELTLDPNGWQALWKIPRIKCEELKIPFPTVVLVFVLDVKYSDLTALVRILAVQDDDIHLPEKHYVPLTQLWPTKQQDKTIALNLNSTANSLDMLRFFFIYLLRPWDEEEDSADWKGEHLIDRLRLYYDLENGNIPKATAEHIRALLNEARRLHSKRQHLADQYDSDVEDRDEKNVETIVEINVRIIEIENELRLLENEVFRKIILKRQESIESKSSKGSEKSYIWVISREDTAKNYMNLLRFVDQLYPNELLSFAPDLMTKLESANPNDTILLSPDKHIIRRGRALIENFAIKGIDNGHNVQIVSLADDVMFDCIGDSSVIENITFDCQNTQCAILVRKGHVTMEKCKIIGNRSSTTHQGILVLKGAKLSLISCELSGFSIAVIGNTGSTVDIKDTVIQDAVSGVKMYDNCQIGIYRSSIKDCREFGIIFETEQDYPSSQVNGNSFNNLDCIPQVIMESVTGSNNRKGDVFIKRSMIKAMENLFENPELDPTILEDSDEDMDTSQGDNLNNTVLENNK